MKKLHLVGLSTDQKNLILSTRRGSKSGAYAIEVNSALVQALQEARAAAETPPTGTARRGRGAAVPATVEFDEILGEQLARARQDSNLSVRDIQARLRRGHRLDEVANEAGVSREWVARFAAPVLAEQAAVVDELRAATFVAPRKGPAGVPVAEAVAHNLVGRGVPDVAEVLEHGWRAHQLDGDDWLVRLEYHYRGRDQHAEWRLQRRSGRLHALNRLASDLAYVAGERGAVTGLVPPAPALRTRPKTASGASPAGDTGQEPTDSTSRPARRRRDVKAAAKRAAVTKSTGKQPPGKQPAGKQISARPTAAKRASATKAAARKAATKKSATAKKPADKGPATAKQRAVNKTVTTKRASAAKRATPKTGSGANKARGKGTKTSSAKRSSKGNNVSTRAGAEPSVPDNEQAPVVDERVDAASASPAPPASAAESVPYVAESAPAANGNGTRRAAGRAGGEAGLLPSEDPFAALDLSTGFSPTWREPTVDAPAPEQPRPPAAPPVPRLQRTEWPPRPAGSSRRGAAPEADASDGSPSAPLRRRRAPLRAER